MIIRLFAALLFGATVTLAQNKIDARKEALLLKKYITEKHVAPPALNDQFSAHVFAGFLEILDPDHVYFTESEVTSLLPFKTRIDNEMNGDGWAFLNQVSPLYHHALERAGQFIEQNTAQPFPVRSKERFLYDSVHWPANEPALKTKWKQWLHYQTLEKLSDLDTGAVEPDFFSQHEPIVRQRIKARELRNIQRVLHHPAGFDQFMTTAYLQCFASVFDPHTTYYPKTEMENFLSSLSTEGYYFGVTLDENDRGDIMIANLAPGSPAWKCGELHATDILVALKWEGQAPVDMTGISIEETNQILTDANHTALEFTVRKSSGMLKTVKLRKEKITMEENFVRSYILKGRSAIGYISLPDFYTQWGEQSEGSRCARDVAAEIMKLKKENIQGLILDLRFNGGGSLHEALAMAGIFIDEGTLVVTKDRLGNEQLLKDMNRGTVYDGPLAVMVNGQSASASELLAGALQDYNRAIVVGNSTFGKATAQNFFPLSSDPKKEIALDGSNADASVASITTHKFYRVTGKSHQGKGLHPDIYIPDLIEALDMKEEDIPFALPADTIYKRTYFKRLKNLPREALRKKSDERIGSSPSFAAIAQAGHWLKGELKKDIKPVVLDWDTYRQEQKQYTEFYTRLGTFLHHDVQAYQVSTLAADHQRIQPDEYARKFNQNWIEILMHDLYVEETFIIVCDLIELSR